MFRVTVDTADVSRRLGALHSDMPTVTRNALNDVAFGLKSHLQDLMRSSFKNPHPTTVKNIFVKKATKESLVARVLFDQIYRKGVDEYMLPLIEGGSRSMKPSERRMNQFWVPAYKSNPGMLNKYGNVPGGKITQILSRLRLFNTDGFNANQTAASKKRLKGASKTTEYFIVTRRSSGLAPGVYQRVQNGLGFGAATKKVMRPGSFQKGTRKIAMRDPKTGRITGYREANSAIQSVVRSRGAKPVMVFTKQPHYSPIFPFFTSGQQYIDDHLYANIDKEIGWAIKRQFKRLGL